MINIEKTQSGTAVEIADGAKSVYIYISALNVPLPVSVCMTSNASHKAWKGQGKAFPSISDALAAYKSPFMKNALQQVAALV